MIATEIAEEAPLLVERVLKEISDVVSAIDDPKKVLDNMVSMVSRMLGVERCSLMLWEPDEGCLTIHASHGVLPAVAAAVRVRPGEGISGWVYSHGKSLLVTDVENHPLFLRRSKVEYSTKSLLSVPLVLRSECIGVLNVNNKADGQVFTEADELLLSVVANFVVIALDKARLHQTAVEKDRLDQDLRVAREIQIQILPDSLPWEKGFAFAARCIPAREVGGDFYDMILLPSHQAALLLGDVCGKGIPAALYMSRVLSYFRAAASLGAPGETLLSSVNELLAAEWNERTFVTACMVLLDKRTGRIQIFSAGHPPPILYRGDTGEVLSIESPTGFPLGVVAGAEFEAVEATLQRGDRLLLYTDGITEAKNAQDDLFGEERLQLAMRYHQGSAERMADDIVDSVVEFTAGRPQSDDITLLVITRD